MVSIILLYRIHKAVADKAVVVDVDGSFLYKKCKRLEKRGRSRPDLDLSASPPLSGCKQYLKQMQQC